MMIKPKDTQKEKIESLKDLLAYLSLVLDLELNHIEPNEIIVTKEVDSVRYLLSILIDMAELFKSNEEINPIFPSEDYNICQLSNTLNNDSSFIKRNLMDEYDDKRNITENRYQNEEEDKLIMKSTNQCNMVQISDEIVNIVQTKNEKGDNNHIDNKKNDIQFSFSGKRQELSDNDLCILKKEDKEKPLSDTALKIELLLIMKNIYTKNEYASLIQREDYPKKIEKLIKKIKSFHNSIFKNTDKDLTRDFILLNKKDISKIIKKLFQPKSLDPSQNLPMKIALAIFDDKEMLRKMYELNNDVIRQQIKTQKENYKLLKEQSDKDVYNVKDLYVQALRMEGERVKEEINNLNEINTLKEEKIVLEGKINTDFLYDKKEYLLELERYEKFKREKQKKIRKLKINPSL